MEAYRDETLPTEQRVEDLIKRMTIEEKVSQLTNSAAAVSRLGIGSYDWWNEALHGVARAGTATVFPQAIGLAAMWDEELMADIACAVSDEARAKYNAAGKKSGRRYYGLTFWSPNINIFRDPRWGRGQETYGEDPLLTSRLAVAFIRGLQGNTEHLKAAACAKHFAAHSGPEVGRHGFNAAVSQKDLFETYLPAFEACVKEAGVEAVMGAYNAINGIPCVCDKEMLTGLLRDKWGFEGHVVSDCGAISDIHACHHYTNSPEESAAAAVKAGCDLNCGSVYAHLTDAWEKDLISEEEIDTALRRTLRTKFRLGFFDKRTEYDDIPYSVVACDRHRELSLRAARESVVLLRNDGLLPLAQEDTGSIAVIGPNGDSRAVLLGSYNGTPVSYSTVLDGIRGRAGERISVKYSRGCGFFERNDRLLKAAVRLAGRSDVCVVCLGLDASFEGEEGDASNPYCAGDRKSIEVIPCQAELLREVSKVCERVILLMFTGGAAAYGSSLADAGAVLHCWYPGEKGGLAIAQLLFGDYSPSGHLPVTFYASDDDLPDMTDYSMEGRTYRYFRGEPAFPFGYGLTYTHFEYGNLSTREDKGRLVFSLTVKNTGKYDAACVVRLFSRISGLPGQPICSLAAFKRVLLRAGGSGSVDLIPDKLSFTYVGEDGVRRDAPAEDLSFFVE